MGRVIHDVAAYHDKNNPSSGTSVKSDTTKSPEYVNSRGFAELIEGPKTSFDSYKPILGLDPVYYLKYWRRLIAP